jgi:hypothetical protein
MELKVRGSWRLDWQFDVCPTSSIFPVDLPSVQTGSASSGSLYFPLWLCSIPFRSDCDPDTADSRTRVRATTLPAESR